ncbi:MAG: flavin reductase family protein [Firmicutes bacterium]|nr:flavin reductase family protein [Bacillota bacterium]
MKKTLNPGTMLAPVPAVMVSCGRPGEKPNIITIAWTGVINSDPPMTYVSVRKERYSHSIISETKEFVINLTTEELAFATDWCGVKSGRDFDKFKEQNLTPAQSEQVACPAIAESPVNIECKVKDVIELGSHDMFIAEIVSISVDEEMIDEKGAVRMDKAGLIAYNHGHYFPLKKQETGRFGYSVMKPKTRKRYEAEKRAKSRQAARRANKSHK